MKTINEKNHYEKLRSKEYIDSYRFKLAELQKKKAISAKKLANLIGISTTGVTAFLLATSKVHSKRLLFQIINWVDREERLEKDI